MRLRLPRLTSAGLWQLLMMWAVSATCAPALLADEAERTMGLVEIRLGPEANPLTTDYLQDVLVGLQKEAHGDLILVPMAKNAAILRRDRDQVPSGLTQEWRKVLAVSRELGIKFLNDADAPNAIHALQIAEGKYRAAIAAPGADDKLHKEYLDILAQLATAHLIAKDKGAAAEVLRKVVTAFGAKANVTDDNYRPDVVELYRKVAKEVAAQPKGQIDVTSDPPGAHVLIHAVDRGVTPMTVADLAPGTYSVRLQLGSASSLLHRVNVASGKKATLTASIEYERHVLLDENQVGLGYADLEGAQRRILSDAVALGRELSMTSVAAVGVLDGSLCAWLIDVAHARIERSSSVKVPASGASPRAVAKVLNTLLGERNGSDGGGRESAESQSVPWYKSVPGILCGVGALAALGVGAAYASNFSMGETIVTTPEAKEDMQTGRVLGGVSLGVGALLAGASAYFFWRQAQSPAATGSDAAHFGRDSLPPPQFGFAPLAFANQPAL